MYVVYLIYEKETSYFVWKDNRTCRATAIFQPRVILCNFLSFLRFGVAALIKVFGFGVSVDRGWGLWCETF